MINHYWTVLCSASTIDKDTNNVSLLNVIERITIFGQSPPKGEVGAVPNPASIVSLWGRSDLNTPERGTVLMIIEFDEGGKPIQTDPHEIGIDLSEYQRLRTRLNLNLLPIMGEGRHWIRVSLRHSNEDGWTPVVSIPYEIVFRPESEASEE